MSSIKASAGADALWREVEQKLVTASFTTSSVAEFFRTDIPPDRQEESRWRFDRLSQRQKGQKATLRYDCGKFRTKCYFDRVIDGATCATTGEQIVKRKSYPSLWAYYQAHQPGLGVKAGDPVARVSFKHIEGSVPAASNRLYLRVMNEALPESLADIDKIAPEDRRHLIPDQVGPAHAGFDQFGFAQIGPA